MELQATIERRSNKAIRAVACLSKVLAQMEIFRTSQSQCMYQVVIGSFGPSRLFKTYFQRQNVLMPFDRPKETQCGSPGKPSSQGLQSKHGESAT